MKKRLLFLFAMFLLFSNDTFANDCSDAYSNADDVYTYAKKGYNSDYLDDVHYYAKKAKSSADDAMSSADDCGV